MGKVQVVSRVYYRRFAEEYGTSIFSYYSSLVTLETNAGKLIRHNTEMNLLLTCVGKYATLILLTMCLHIKRCNRSSSLNRIESSTKALEIDVIEIKTYIRASSGNLNSQASGPPSVSVVDDEMFKISLSAILMGNAEVLQPWNTIGVDQWIQAGRWWLLKVSLTISFTKLEVFYSYLEQSQMELYAGPASDKSIPVPAYANLIKASWILVDIIAGHPQVPFFTSNTHFDVQLLSAVSHSSRTWVGCNLRLLIGTQGAKKGVQTN
jgi:hypothetical protein